MFRHLFDFARRRTTAQAIGFYLFYLVIGTALVGVATTFAGSFAEEPSPAPLVVTRPTEGSTTASDGQTTIVAFADGTRTVTVGDATDPRATITIAADGSVSSVSNGGSQVVNNVGGTTWIDVGGVKIEASADGSTTLYPSSGAQSGVQDLVGSAVGVLFAATMSLLVLQAKGYLGHVGYLLLVVASVGAAPVGGLILALPFAAFLSTRPADAATREPLAIG